jgi:DNA-binding response OmpR family regulator
MTRLLRTAALSDGLRPALVVSPDVLASTTLRRDLAVLGLEVRCVSTFAEATAAVTSGAYGVALIDVSVPGGDGFELVRIAREAGGELALVLVSSRDDLAARVHGFECGADECLTLPVHGDELRARVKALVRRQRPAAVGASTRVPLGIGWFERTRGIAHTHEGQLVLSMKERLLLCTFIDREGEVLSRDELLDAAWGADANPSDRTVDNHIVRLRRLFEPQPAEPRLLLTVRARGYVLHRHQSITPAHG